MLSPAMVPLTIFLVAALCADEALILDMTHPPFKDQPNNYGVRVMLCVPMMLAGRLAGIMTYNEPVKVIPACRSQILWTWQTCNGIQNALYQGFRRLYQA